MNRWMLLGTLGMVFMLGASVYIARLLLGLRGLAGPSAASRIRARVVSSDATAIWVGISVVDDAPDARIESLLAPGDWVERCGAHPPEGFVLAPWDAGAPENAAPDTGTIRWRGNQALGPAEELRLRLAVDRPDEALPALGLLVTVSYVDGGARRHEIAHVQPSDS